MRMRIKMMKVIITMIKSIIDDVAYNAYIDDDDDDTDNDNVYDN